MDADGHVTLAAIGAIAAVPALAMVGGSCALRAAEPSESTQARMQHLSAGLLIGAVVAEIFPILRRHLYTQAGDGTKDVHFASLAAALVGVVAALGLMYGLKALELEGEAAEGEGECDGTACGSGAGGASNERQESSESGPLRRPLLDKGQGVGGDRGLQRAIETLAARTASLEQLANLDPVEREAIDEEVHYADFLADAVRRRLRGEGIIDVGDVPRLRSRAAALADDIARIRQMDPGDLPAIDTQLGVIAARLRQIHIHANHPKCAFRRWGSKIEQGQGALLGSTGTALAAPAPVPWGLVFAVVVDSMVDGMLIGLAGSVALYSGWMMSLATAIEMGFLGYSFACSIAKTGARRPLAAALLGLPPVAMTASAVAAFALAAPLQTGPAFAGLIAFALVALLFLVVEELLLEAQEKATDAWHVSIWLYVGLLLTFSLDVVAH